MRRAVIREKNGPFCNFLWGEIMERPEKKLLSVYEYMIWDLPGLPDVYDYSMKYYHF